MSLYREILEERCAKHLSREPDLAKTVAQVLARLRNHEIYEQELVDAIFQKWDRFPINFTDAYGFVLAYTEILQGWWRVARITVGEQPAADAQTKLNNDRLKKLGPQFGAEFWGGKGDHDGDFWWHDHLHLGGYVIKDDNDELSEGRRVTVGPGKIALEVGYQDVGKTLEMMRTQRAIARWPYDSDCIWVIADCSRDSSRFASIETACRYDTDRGWPCAYTRQTEEAPT